MIKVTGTITVIEGYDAIRVFVEAVWRRHGKPGDQIEFLLGGMKWADGASIDPATWQDWLAPFKWWYRLGPARPPQTDDRVGARRTLSGAARLIRARCSAKAA
jgi:hypothetical protein